MKWVPIRVEFRPRSEAGRALPPTGPSYACTAIFTGERGPDEWSVVLDLAASPPRLRFLFDEAPSHLLRPGVRLDLREGARPVGFAVVRPSLNEIDTELASLHFVRALAMVRDYQDDPMISGELRDQVLARGEKAGRGIEAAISPLGTSPLPPPPRPQPALRRQLTEYAEP